MHLCARVARTAETMYLDECVQVTVDPNPQHFVHQWVEELGDCVSDRLLRALEAVAAFVLGLCVAALLLSHNDC